MSAKIESAGAVLTVTDDTFAELVLRAERPVLLDVWAEWCPPCKAISRTLAELSVEFAGRITVAALDADANPATARAYRVLSMPTLLVFRGGEVVASAVGARPKAALREFLERHATV